MDLLIIEQYLYKFISEGICSNRVEIVYEILAHIIIVFSIKYRVSQKLSTHFVGKLFVIEHYQKNYV